MFILCLDYVCMAGDRGVAHGKYNIGTRYLLAISDNQEKNMILSVITYKIDKYFNALICSPPRV